MPAEHIVEERAVALLLHQRQHGAERGGDVAVHGEVQRRAPAQAAEIVIDLDGVTLREKRIVGEVGPEQQQQVGLMGRVIAGAVAQQPAHPDVVGVVVLDPFLAAQRVPDRAVQLPGQLHHGVVGAADAGAAEERHRARR